MYPLIGFLIILIYYLIVWHRVGRDPNRDAIIPLFHPPKGLTPAAAHYLLHQGFSDRTFSTALIGLAVKGALNIQSIRDGFLLQKRASQKVPLSAGERATRDALFAKSGTIELTQTNREILNEAQLRLKGAMDMEMAGILFETNRSYLIAGMILSVLVVTASLMLSSQINGLLIITLAFAAWTFGCIGITLRAYYCWREYDNNPNRLVPALINSLLTVPFWAGEYFGVNALIEETSLFVGLITFASFLLTPLFLFLLKTPTLQGHRLMDQIEGFRLYLSVTEAHRLAKWDAPTLTPEVYEKYLPYAYALDVPVAWGQRFDHELDLAAEGPLKGSNPDTPSSEVHTRVSKFPGDTFFSAVQNAVALQT